MPLLVAPRITKPSTVTPLRSIAMPFALAAEGGTIVTVPGVSAISVTFTFCTCTLSA